MKDKPTVCIHDYQWDMVGKVLRMKCQKCGVLKYDRRTDKKSTYPKELLEKAHGFWIVFDLDSNRKIQSLLGREQKQFWFFPSFKVFKEHLNEK